MDKCTDKSKDKQCENEVAGHARWPWSSEWVPYCEKHLEFCKKMRLDIKEIKVYEMF